MPGHRGAGVHQRAAEHVPEVTVVGGRSGGYRADVCAAELTKVEQRQCPLDRGPSGLGIGNGADGVGQLDGLPELAELVQDAHVLGDAHRGDDLETACLGQRLEILAGVPLGCGAAPVVQGAGQPLPAAESCRRRLVQDDLLEPLFKLRHAAAVAEPEPRPAAHHI